MTTCRTEKIEAFALWITGLPASGKSTLAAALRQELRHKDVPVVVLESDAMRNILTPGADYSAGERDRFYSALVDLGAYLVDQGIPVVFDATAHLRRYRNAAATRIARFLEVYVDCPIEVCAQRDPKGLYAKAARGEIKTVPGLGTPYQAPESADLEVAPEHGSAQDAAGNIVALLARRGFLSRECARDVDPACDRAMEGS